MTLTDPARRRLVLSAGALLLAAALPARAAGAAEARAFVEATIAELFAIARSGQGVPAQRAAFRELVARRVAITQVARSVLGQAWRAATPAQQAAYLEAFQDYVARKYGSRFEEFTQVRMEVLAAKDLGERGVVVDSRATLANGETAQVEWGVSARSGQLLISNIVVEGVSLVTSEREMIAGMLDRAGGNLDRLIAELRALGG